jgi:integrase
MRSVHVTDVGTYRVRYRQNALKNGAMKYMDRSQTFRRKQDAEMFAAILGDGKPARVREALDWLERRTGAEADTVAADTFATHFERYVNELTGVTSRTRDDYRAMHRRYLTHLDAVPISQVGRPHITALVNGMEDRGLSPKTIKNAVNMLSSCLGLAVDDGLLARNPTKRVRLPKQNKVGSTRRLVFLTHEEFGQLYNEMPAHYKPLVLFLAGSGLRWSEATALQWRHVDLVNGTVRVEQAWKRVAGGWEVGPPKTEMGIRTVNPDTRALVALAFQSPGMKPGDYVFTTPQGNVVRHSNFYNRIWAPAVTASGLDPRPKIKDLRSTHASWLISDGVRLEAVQAQLGHESYETTRKVYAHLLPAVGVDVGRAASAAMERALVGHTPLEIEATP